jgi:cytochrome c-type biogenesis protein CcmH
VTVRRIGIALALLGVLAAAPGARAADPSSPSSASPAPAGHSYKIDLYNGLMSPFCPGRTLMDCPSPQAAKLREWIAQQEAAGRSRDEVEEQLYREYGDVILQEPRARGFGIAAYAIPAVLIVAGGVIVWVFLRRQGRDGSHESSRGRDEVPPGGLPIRGIEPLDPEIERRIDEEMRG